MVCEWRVSWCASVCIMVCEWRVSWCASGVYHGVRVCRVSWCASVMSCIMVCECDVVYHGVRV